MKGPTFLAPRSYRQRRDQDAARVLPIVGAVLFLLPVLWLAPGPEPDSTARGFFYVFAVWALLILCAVILSLRLRRSVAAAEEDNEETP